jgi:fluoride ion exporter CrcB/FEX
MSFLKHGNVHSLELLNLSILYGYIPGYCTLSTYAAQSVRILN